VKLCDSALERPMNCAFQTGPAGHLIGAIHSVARRPNPVCNFRRLHRSKVLGQIQGKSLPGRTRCAKCCAKCYAKCPCGTPLLCPRVLCQPISTNIGTPLWMTPVLCQGVYLSLGTALPGRRISGQSRRAVEKSLLSATHVFARLTLIPCPKSSSN